MNQDIVPAAKTFSGQQSRVTPRFTLGWCVVLALGGIVYLNSLSNPLFLDDYYVVGQNPMLFEQSSLVELLANRGVTGSPILETHYRPLLMASLWLNAQLFGNSVAAFRAVNIALHLACVLVFGLFAQRFLARLRPEATKSSSRAIALIAGAIFALHPVFSEAVNQIYKRSSSLAALLMFAALIFLDSAERRNKTRPAFFGLSLLCAGLALLAKESAVVMPALVALVAIATRAWQGNTKRGLTQVASFAVAPLLFLIFFFPRGAMRLGEHAGLMHLFAQPAAVLDYLGMLVLPSRIPVVSGLAPAAWPPQLAQVAGFGLLVALIVLALLLWRRFRLASFAVLFAAIWLAPTSSFFPAVLVADPISLYGAMAGVLVLLAAGLHRFMEAVGKRMGERLGRGASLLGASPVLAICLFSFLGTLEVNDLHGNSIRAWRHAVSLYPDARIPNANFCTALLEGGALEPALPQCRRAAKLDPKNPYVVSSLVKVLTAQGALEEARRTLGAALAEIGPVWQLVLLDGHLAWTTNDLERALRAYTAVLSVHPRDIQARLYLADTRQRLGVGGVKELIETLPESAMNERDKNLLAAVRRRLEAVSAPPPR